MDQKELLEELIHLRSQISTMKLAGNRMAHEAERLLDAYDLKKSHLKTMINEWTKVINYQ